MLKLLKQLIKSSKGKDTDVNLPWFMENRFPLIFIISLFTVAMAGAQPCTTLGQTPSTAFPVCGVKKFTQSTVPICSTNPLYVPGCSGNDNANYQNKNPFFYKFTCYTSGTLGFVITPFNLGDDYDWQLYDITGQNPNAIFSNNSLVVTGNWAGTYGLTGASANGVNFIQCASDPSQNLNAFSTMPQLIAGHEYLLLVSHYTDTQSGYTLEFGGGTASITDPVIPSLKSAEPDCDRTKITIKLGKKIKCNSLAPDGSDFSLSPAAANIIGATGFNCNASFDTDSILLILDAPLPAGNYFATAKNGIDNNTLLDNCDNQMPVGEKIDFVVTLPTPTPIDSLVPLTCAPDKLTLVFRKKIKCASIAPDGSDFIITGTYPVTITGAMGNCNTNGTTSTIDIKLSQPITQAGNFTITLKNGLDGDPIIDECGIPTPIGQGQSFVTKDTVNANFTFAISKGCKNDTVYFSHPGGNQINKWTWDLENGRTSNMQNPAYIYLTQGVKTVSLTVSNGFCNHTATQSLTLEEKVKAAFTGPDILCPEDGAVFIDSSISATTWQWDFDNGQTSAVKSPLPQYYPPTNNEKDYTIELIVSDGMCFDTTYRNMKVVKSCYIAIPNAFTPDNNGLNDFLYPLNAYKADNLEFKVYNRYGQLVFQTNNWKIKWDGNIKGNPQPAGTYVWYLKYKERDTGKNVFLKGTTVLIR